MNRLFKLTTAALLVASAPLCTACSTVSAITGVLTTISGGGGVQCQVPLSVAKGYYIEEAAYSGVLYGLDSAVKTGVLVKGTPTSQKAHDILQQRVMPAHAAVGQAIATCNASQLSAQVAAAEAAIADLQLLLAKGS